MTPPLETNFASGDDSFKGTIPIIFCPEKAFMTQLAHFTLFLSKKRPQSRLNLLFDNSCLVS